MTTLVVPAVRISFPEGWSVLTSDTRVQDAVEALSAGAPSRDPESRAQLSAALESLLRLMRIGRVRAFAAFHLVVHDPLAVVTATCAITIEPLDVQAADPLHALVVVDAPHPMGAAHVAPCRAGGSVGIRATVIREALELAGPTQSRPLMGVARYVVPLNEAVGLLLHFETLSLGYADELLEMFDAIANATLGSGDQISAPPNGIQQSW